MQEFKYRYFQRDAINSMPPTDQAGGTITPPAEAQDDPVNSPKHYVRGGIEVIEVLEKKMAPEAFKGFLMGNVLKYVLRHEYKNGTEDLKKARFYLERMIALDGSHSS